LPGIGLLELGLPGIGLSGTELLELGCWQLPGIGLPGIGLSGTELLELGCWQLPGIELPGIEEPRIEEPRIEEGLRQQAFSWVDDKAPGYYVRYRPWCGHWAIPSLR
jgi:hypothetical protein